MSYELKIRATFVCTRRPMVEVTTIRGASGAWGVRISGCVGFDAA